MSGAFSGAGSINPEWLEELQGRRNEQATLAGGLVGAASAKLKAMRSSLLPHSFAGIPVHWDDLPEDSKQHGFDNLKFRFTSSMG